MLAHLPRLRLKDEIKSFRKCAILYPYKIGGGRKNWKNYKIAFLHETAKNRF